MSDKDSEESNENFISHTISSGEGSAIRAVDTGSEEELQVLGLMDKDQNIIDWFISHPEKYTPLTREELKNFAVFDSEHQLWAISGAKGHVEKGEEFKLQGWVLVNPDKKHRVAQLVTNGVIAQEQDVFEVAVAKRANYTSEDGSEIKEAGPGQIASGLRQVIRRLVAARVETDPDTTNGLPNFEVVAYIMDKQPPNISERVALAWGFEEVLVNQRVWYDELPEDRAPRPDRVFKLNWQKYMEIEKTKTIFP